MTQDPDNNSGNDFIRGLETRACVNGMTKSDVERLKNALVKKILDDETVIEITEDGGIVADSDGLFIKLNGKQLGLSIDGEEIIPVTEPYLPEDENENPLAPPNDTIMTSANIAVDPRIVHTFGNETIDGIKIFKKKIDGITNFLTTDNQTIGTYGYFKTFLEIDKTKLTGIRNHFLFYIISRTRSTGFDFISLYTSSQVINSMNMVLRTCNANYTYVLSEDDEKAYLSIICSNDASDGIQAGILITTESFNYDAFITGSRITPNVLGTEKGRLTP